MKKNKNIHYNITYKIVNFSYKIYAKIGNKKYEVGKFGFSYPYAYTENFYDYDKRKYKRRERKRISKKDKLNFISNSRADVKVRYDNHMKDFMSSIEQQKFISVLTKSKNKYLQINKIEEFYTTEIIETKK